MLLRDRPLLVAGIDAGLYVDRPELEASIAGPLLEGRNVLILGEAGSGKSTLLRKVAVDLERRGRPAVIVNAAIADDAAGLLDLIEIALHDHLAGGSQRQSRPEEPLAARLLRGARRLQHDQSAAILIDGLIDARIGYELFGRLRDELWSSGHSWAVSARPRDSAALRTPPAEAFWSRVAEIHPLSNQEAARLLKLGLSAEEFRSIGEDPHINQMYPRNLVRWARERLERRGQDEPAGEDWQSVVTRTGVGRSEALALAELHGLGRPVSAHDPEFLERLGWSRPYAQRILSGLEGRGLLRSIPERSDRPGRPRKLYELDRRTRQ
jgi:hypothetical protein